MFTDESVHCAGPIRPGPSLHEWAQEIDDDTLAALAPPELVGRDPRPRRHDVPDPPRPVGVPRVVPPPGARRAARRTSRSSSTTPRPSTCSDGPDGRQAVALDGRAEPLARRRRRAGPRPPRRRARRRSATALAAFAAEHGLVVPPGRAHRRAGPVGLRAGGRRAHPRLRSGVHRPADPRHRGAWRPVRRRRRRQRCATSRAGESRSSTSARAAACRTGRSSTTGCRRHRPRCPRFLDDAGDRAPARPATARSSSAATCCRSSLKEIGWASYHELFLAHPSGTTCRGTSSPTRFAEPMTARRSTALVAETVPDPADRFDLEALDRPLAGLRFESADDAPRPRGRARRRRRGPPHRSVLQRRPRRVHGDAAQLRHPRTDRRLGSADAAVARRGPRAVVVQLLHVLRQRTAARPPAPVPGPRRGRAAALHRRRHGGHGRHRPRAVSSPAAAAIPRRSAARALVDARIAAPSVSRTADGLLRRLHERGDVVEEVVSDDDGWTANTGKVVVAGPDLRLAAPGRHGPPAASCRRRVHQPPGGRRLRPSPHQRPGVPPARSGRPGRPHDAGILATGACPPPSSLTLIWRRTGRRSGKRR